MVSGREKITRMDPKTYREARELNTIQEALPGIEIRNSKLIEIIKEGYGHNSLGKEVRGYLENNATFLGEEKISAGLGGFMKTREMTLGTTRKLYGVAEGGKILYDEADIIGKYASAIRLD